MKTTSATRQQRPVSHRHPSRQRSRIGLLGIESTLVCETEGTASPELIQDSRTALSVFRPCFEGLDREHFLVCGLDAKHRVIGINVVSVGTLTLSIVHPREVFKPLIAV